MPRLSQGSPSSPSFLQIGNKSHFSKKKKTMFSVKIFVCFSLEIFVKNCPFPDSFSYFCFFSVQLTVHNVQYKFCRWLDSNLGPLVSEATALPTEPQPLPISYVWQIISFVNSSPIQKIDRPGLNVITKAALICQSSSCDFHKPINDSDQSSFFKIAL